MKFKAQDLTRISFMAALTFISGFVVIPLGPVPITLQTLFVLLTGFILSERAAFFAQLLHLLLAVLIRGASIVMAPSFGFLIAFVVVAPFIAWLKNKRNIRNFTLLTILATLIIYLIGTPYMVFILNVVLESGLSFVEIVTSGVLLFLPGDIIKGIMAVMVIKSLVRRYSREYSQERYHK